MPLTSSTRSARFSEAPARIVNWVVTMYSFCSRSAKSIRRTVTCSPFSPKGMDRSPVSQAANSSLALRSQEVPAVAGDLAVAPSEAGADGGMVGNAAAESIADEGFYRVGLVEGHVVPKAVARMRCLTL